MTEEDTNIEQNHVTADRPNEGLVMAERIELTVHINDYPDGWDLSPAMWECWLVGKLKDAGVPVEGTLDFRGIKQGTLTCFDDPKDFGATKYIWEP